jgi:hypothetical protein
VAKASVEIRSLARQHTEEAVNALLRIIRKDGSTDSAVVAAASYLIDRGWGKATQPLSGDEDGPLIKFTRIELVGVRPTAQDT